MKSFHLDRETLNNWIKLSGSNYLDQIIWIKLSGSNYLDQIIWIKLSRSNFISIFWINFLNQFSCQFSYHFSYQFTRIIRNSENHSNQEKFENAITKLNQNIQNNQMQFLILWIPRNFSRSKISKNWNIKTKQKSLEPFKSCLRDSIANPANFHLH